MVNNINSFKKRDLLGRLFAFLFIVSIGIGDFASIGPVKLSYITTILFLLYSFFIEKRQSILRGNKARVFLFLITWLIYSAFQIIWAIDFQLWISFYRSLFLNILIVGLIINYVENNDDWFFLSKSFMFLILLCLLVGIWEYFTSQHIHYMNYSEMNSATVAILQNKPLSFYGNINDNSSVLFLGLFVSLIYFSSNKSNSLITTMMRLLFCVLIIFEIFIIDSRAIVFSLFLFAIVVFCFIISSYFKPSNKKGILHARTLLFVLCVLFLLTVLFIHPFEYYLQFLSSGSDYQSDLFRINIIKNCFNAFLQTGCLGLGPGQSIAVNGINVHSLYLEILFEYGIFIGGFVLLVFFKMYLDESKTDSRICDSIIRSFPIVLLLAGVSSSKMFSLRAFWIAFAIVFIIKYRFFENLSKSTSRYNLNYINIQYEN